MSNLRDFSARDRDAFGRLRVSSPFTLFDSKVLVDDRDDLYDEATTGSGASSTFNTNQSSVDLDTTVSTAGTVTRQSKRRFAYQPGKSQLAFLTCVPGATTGTTIKRWGLFDDQDGVYFRHDSTGFSIGIRSYTSGSAVDTEVAEASWNLATPTIDETKSQIFVIDFEWLGVGAVRFGVVQPDGGILFVHRVENANTTTGVYMRNPNLPIRWEIDNPDTSGSASTLTTICASVQTEGGNEFTGTQVDIDCGITPLSTAVGTSIYPLLAVRLKSTHVRFANVQVKNVSVFSQNSNQFRWMLLRNPTLATGSYSWVTTGLGASRAVEYATPTVAETLTANTGDMLLSGYADATAEPSVLGVPGVPVQIGATIGLTSDILVVAAQNQISANNQAMLAAMSLFETI